jgi:signal transduction histidine kinase
MPVLTDALRHARQLWRTGSRRAVWGLALVLVTSGLFVAGIVHEASIARREQRASSARRMHDYGLYAAWSVRRLALEASWVTMRGLFDKVTAFGRPTLEPAPPLSRFVATADSMRRCACAEMFPIRIFFLLDRDRKLIVQPGEGKRDAPTWLRDTVLAIAARTASWKVELVHGAGPMSVIGVGLRRNGRGDVASIYGFVADAREYGEGLYGFLRVSGGSILPGEIVQGAPVDKLYDIALTAPDGSPGTAGAVLWSAGAWDTSVPADSADLPASFGCLLLKVRLRPTIASMIAHPAHPPSRLPIYLSLLILNLAGAILFMRQLAKEHELALMRAQFTASVSHELRTPLAQILLYGETLTLGRTRNLAERQRASEIIVREGRRLLQLVENALHFARSDRQAMRLSPRPTDVGAQIRDVIAVFSPVARAGGSAIDVIDEEKPCAQADPNALRHVLLNLLDNAVRHGRRGQTITVRTRAVAGMVRVEVVDRGPGVADDERERIWQPFVRGRAAVEQSVTGSGIGLAVVRDLVVRQGGRVWVEKAHPIGAMFVVELPAAEASAAPNLALVHSGVDGGAA